MGWHFFLLKLPGCVHHRGQSTKGCRFAAEDASAKGADLQPSRLGLGHFLLLKTAFGTGEQAAVLGREMPKAPNTPCVKPEQSVPSVRDSLAYA